MATTALTPQSSGNGWRQMLRRPGVALALLIVYIAGTALVLFNLDRTGLWYPLTQIVFVPLFLFSPFVVVSAPIKTIYKVIIGGILLLVLMPVLGIYNTSWLELAIQICVFTGLALGLNIVVGFAGLLDLGYVAFFAVGAYIWGSLTSPADTIFTVNGWTVNPGAFYLFIIIGALVAAGVGILLGLPVLRLRGDYLAIVTLGFGEVIRVLARNADAPINLTNGSQGLHGIAGPPVPGIALGFTTSIASAMGLRIDNPDVVAEQLLFYVIGIVIIAVIVLISRRLLDSPIGRAWTAIREDEVAALAMGVPLVKSKLMAFAMGAAFGGMIGTLFAAKQTFIDPSSFVLLQSITILAMVIVGGIGSIKGVMVGAMLITLLDLSLLTNLSLQLNNLRNADAVIPIINFHIRDWPNELEPAKYQPLVFGLILVLMMIFRPAGLLPEKRRQMELRERRDDGDEEPMLRETPSGVPQERS
jgi:branched-chain amino acid transport system permease protein